MVRRNDVQAEIINEQQRGAAANMSGQRELTAQIGEHLLQDLTGRGYEVHYDHDVLDGDAGTIVSWFEGENGYGRESELSQLDLAVVEEGTRRAVLLIEIEEASDPPKALLGDLYGVLLGDEIHVKGHPAVSVDAYTTLLVASVSAIHHRCRDEYLEEKVNAAKAGLGMGNARLGQVLIWSYRTLQEMGQQLPGDVGSLISAREAEMAQV
jgi:hypothetical protein